jgi:hypothetical protein
MAWRKPVIRIERGPELDGRTDGKRHGIFEYHAPAYPLVRGYSRQPLLDACRQLKSLYGLTQSLAGLFREGSEIADISCPLEAGAATTVSESSTRFAKYQKFEAFQEKTSESEAA